MTKISALINLHREGLYAPASLRSFLASCREAREHGLMVEPIAMLDRPDRLTAGCVENRRSEFALVREVDFGDLASSRNAGTAAATGDLIAFFDGDDLWGSNWLWRAAEDAAALAGEDAVFHPEVVYYFDAADYAFQSNADQPHPSARSFFIIHQDSAGETFDAGSIVFNNIWTANGLAPRRLHERFPYPQTSRETGFGVEDWTWNIETLAAGVRHAVVRGTVELVRIKETGSLSTQNVAEGLLPPIHRLIGDLERLS